MLTFTQIIDALNTYIESCPETTRNEKDHKLFCLDAITALYRAKMGYDYLNKRKQGV